MKCRRAQTQLLDLLDAEPCAAPDEALRQHLETCPHCTRVFQELTQTAEALRPTLRVGARPGFTEATMNRLNTIEMPQTGSTLTHARPKRAIWKPFLAATTALALLVAGAFMLHATRNHGPNASAFSPLWEAVHAMSNLQAVHISGRMRTPAQDNFELILLDHEFTPVEMWKQFADPPRWRVEKPGRVAVMDGDSGRMLIGSTTAAQLGKNTGAVGFLQTLLDVNQVIENEIARAQAEGSVVTVANEAGEDGSDELAVHVEARAQGDYANDWLRNKTVTESDNLRVYRLDAETKRLKGLQIFVHAPQGDVLVFETTRIVYDAAQEPQLYALQLPKDVIWLEAQPKPTQDDAYYAQLTPQQVAKAFFQACAEENWDEALKFYQASRIEDKSKIYLGGLKIVSIGEPFKSGLYPGWFVPYEIKLKSEQAHKKFNLAVRNDNPARRYVVDGGI